MPRFKLILEDTSGKSRSATVEAASQADAIDLARRKGYHVQQIEPVYDLGDDAPAEELAAARPEASAKAASPARGRASGGAKPDLVYFLIPTILAAAAFLLAAVTLIYVLASDPLGSGLGKYDFSSPREAYVSEMEIEKNVDLRAQIQYQRKFGEHSPRGKRIREKIDSYELRKEIDYGSRKGLFVSYKVNGVKRHEVVWYEKDEDSGYWVEADVPLTEVEKRDQELAGEIRNFLSTGEIKKN